MERVAIIDMGSNSIRFIVMQVADNKSYHLEYQQKEATKFRNFLLDNGFSMVQYSIYTKLFSGKDACQKYYGQIRMNLPEEGKVDIVTITDRQYENIISYQGKQKTEKKQAEQLELF